MDNYEKLVERIAKSSGLKKEEIERKIEAKKAKLSGLISKEGAAQIVAAELGINFDNERLKISELIQGMKRANVLGKIISINPVREYNKGGRQGKVCSFLLADESANIRAVMWDTNHIALVEQGKLKDGSIVEISNANVRNSELHLSSFADIKLSKENLGDVITEKKFHVRKLKDVRPGENLQIRAFIVNAFEPKYFDVCSLCGKKVIEKECKEHGKVEPLKRALLSIILDDGSESIRGVLFGEEINKLGLDNETIFSLENYGKAKPNILGEEKYFTGQIRQNQLFNTTEFAVQGIEEIDPKELVKELEQKIK